ncbi:transposase (plasmid) [Arthrobacter agilis]|uniref:transposase n=1 Tax=Arthrobacter agilis TaxID=37921 RepID=UPI002366CD73|nr:transposase [Arthrobacter agilis]WDF35293.1 transposase [Arthrobacter agilis]
MLTDLISQIHIESRGIYGARRVHAELTLGRGVEVGHGQVELLMRRAELQGISGRRKWKRIRADDISTDLVKRAHHARGAEPAAGHGHHRTSKRVKEKWLIAIEGVGGVRASVPG